MLYLQGQVINVFRTPEGKNQETGEVYGGQYKVQLLVEDQLKNRENRMSMETLTTQEPDKFKEYVGQTVIVPVSAFAPNGGKNVPVRFSMGKGEVIEGFGTGKKSEGRKPVV